MHVGVESRNRSHHKSPSGHPFAGPPAAWVPGFDLCEILRVSLKLFTSYSPAPSLPQPWELGRWMWREGSGQGRMGRCCLGGSTGLGWSSARVISQSHINPTMPPFCAPPLAPQRHCSPSGSYGALGCAETPAKDRDKLRVLSGYRVTTGYCRVAAWGPARAADGDSCTAGSRVACARGPPPPCSARWGPGAGQRGGREPCRW